MVNSPCNLLLQTQISRPPPSNRATYYTSGVVIPPSSPCNTQSVRVPTTPAHVFFLRKKNPASHRARVGTSTASLALGANREGKERVKGKASRVQSTRIGSALVYVRRNVQHRELKLSKSTRFTLTPVAMTAVPTGCVVSPPPPFSQNVQSHEKSPQAIRHRVYHQRLVWRWARIVRAREKSRLKLVGYEVAEGGLRPYVYAETHSIAS